MLEREQKGVGIGQRILRVAIYLAYYVVLVEAMLWAVSAVVPSIQARLANSYAEKSLLQDPRLGFIGNPRHPHIDPRGFRNEKALTSAEIVTIGDSFTYGSDVASDESWPMQLQRILSMSVYNMGIPARGPGQYHYLVGQALELHPDWVVTGFYIGNDLWDSMEAYYRLRVPDMDWKSPDSNTVRAVRRRVELLVQDYETLEHLSTVPPEASIVEKAALPVRLAEWVKGVVRDHSKMWGAVRAIRSGLRRRYGVEGGSADESERHDPSRWTSQDEKHWKRLVAAADSNPGLLTIEVRGVRSTLYPGSRLNGVDVEHDPLLREGLDLSLHELERMDREVEEAGAQHLVVLIPTREFLYAPFLSDPADSLVKRAAAAEALVWGHTKVFLTAHGIDYVDTAPDLRKAIDDGVVVFHYYPGGHFTVEGYRIVAEAVARALGERS